MIIRTCCAVAILASMANCVLAQETVPASRPASTQPFRDPTEAGPQLRQALQQPATMPDAVARPPRTIPQIVRRGFIEVAGQPAEALIEIQGGLHTVRGGTTLSVTVPGEGTLAIRVTRVSRDAIEIEFVETGQSVVIP